MNVSLTKLLQQYPHRFSKVVQATHGILMLDFTSANESLQTVNVANTSALQHYIEQQLLQANCTWGVGGYNEDRVLYKRSALFDNIAEARTIHLGIDIWGAAGTAVYAPLAGKVHSFAFNNHFGDYGATIILQHQFHNTIFHTLYGHLSLADIEHLTVGKPIEQGELFAHFGAPHENGDWPPHLHFQIIEDMQGKLGDYPGVCSKAEREQYLSNCPDANLILQML